jgi:hypothetical protein
MDYGRPPFGMRYATWLDLHGRKFLVMLPDSAPDEHIEHGIVLGPPDLTTLDLPRGMEVRLHNMLYERGLIVRRDFERRPQEVVAALQAAFRVDGNRIIQLASED